MAEKYVMCRNTSGLPTGELRVGVAYKVLSKMDKKGSPCYLIENEKGEQKWYLTFRFDATENPSTPTATH